MRNLFGILLIGLFIGIGVCAQGPSRVPAYRGLIMRVQPNGDSLRTYLRGDERMHWSMTEDGWQIVQNKRGWYVYCKGERMNGERLRVKGSCQKAHNAEKRSKREQRWLEKYGIRKTQ